MAQLVNKLATETAATSQPESPLEIFNRLLDEKRLKEILQLIQLDKRITPNDRIIWKTLFDILKFRDTRTGSVYYEQLHRMTGISISTMKRSVKRLIQTGYISALHHLQLKTKKWSCYEFTVLLPEYIYNQIDLEPSRQVKVTPSLLNHDQDKELRIKDYYLPTEIGVVDNIPEPESNFVFLEKIPQEQEKEFKSPISFADMLKSKKSMTPEEGRALYSQMRKESQMDSTRKAVEHARKSQRMAKQVQPAAIASSVEAKKIYIPGFESPFLFEPFVFGRLMKLRKALDKDIFNEVVYSVANPKSGRDQGHQLNYDLWVMRQPDMKWVTPPGFMTEKEAIANRMKNAPIAAKSMAIIESINLPRLEAGRKELDHKQIEKQIARD